MIFRIFEQTIPYNPRIIKPRINIYLGILPNLSWLEGKSQDSIVKAMLIIYMGLFYIHLGERHFYTDIITIYADGKSQGLKSLPVYESW